MRFAERRTCEAFEAFDACKQVNRKEAVNFIV
jgi:hypothetical protein